MKPQNPKPSTLSRGMILDAPTLDLGAEFKTSVLLLRELEVVHDPGFSVCIGFQD